MGWGLGRYPPHTAGITQRSPPHRHRRAQRGSHLRLWAPQIPCVFVGTEYRVAGRPRGAAGACSPVLLSSAAARWPWRLRTLCVRRRWFSRRAVGLVLAAATALLCASSASPSSSTRVMRAARRFFAVARLLVCGAVMTVRPPVVGPGHGAPCPNGRRAHARTTDCSCPQRGGVGAAATTKAHPTERWRAAGWSSLAGITGGHGCLGVRVCSGVCAPASRSIWYGCGPTTRSKILIRYRIKGVGLALRWPVGHTGV